MLEAMVLFGLFLLGTHALSRSIYQRGGRQVARDLAVAFSADHQFASVRAQDFAPLLDLDFYDRQRAFFEGKGFRWVDDIEDLTMTGQFPQNRTFIRLMVSGDGQIRTAFHHVRPRGSGMALFQALKLVPRDLYTLELATEFSEGKLVITNNARQHNPLDSPPEFDLEQFDEATPARELLQIHQTRVERFLERHPEEPIHTASSREELMAAIRRALLLIERFRSQNPITLTEVERLSGTSRWSKRSAAELHKEIEQARTQPPGPHL